MPLTNYQQVQTVAEEELPTLVLLQIGVAFLGTVLDLFQFYKQLRAMERRMI
jgi:hypothetical protein